MSVAESIQPHLSAEQRLQFSVPGRSPGKGASAAGGRHMSSERGQPESAGAASRCRGSAIPSMPGPRVSRDLLTPSTRTGAVVPWRAALHVQHRPGRALVVPDLLLQQHQPLEEGLRPRRAARDVHVHRQDLVHPLHHAVDVVHPARVGATPHGDHPLRLGHLLVEPEDAGGHLLEDGAGDHHEVGLARGAAQHFGAEAGDVVAGGEGGHHFDETAGKAEEHRPEGIGAPPVDEVVKAGEENIVGNMFGGYVSHRLHVNA